MLEHVAVAAVCVPFILLIGVWNTRRRWLTPGEVRFWGVALSSRSSSCIWVWCHDGRASGGPDQALRSGGCVESVDLAINSGEFVVLVGPSGSGKTTCLRMIAGLETVTSGSIFIGDTDVAQVHAKDRNVAMVFQSYALYPHMSVADNMGFALKIRKLPRDEIERRVREVAAILGLTQELPRRRRRSPAVSSSAWPSAGPSCVTLQCSCSTSLSPISTPSSASPCGASSSSCITASTRR